MGKKYILLIDNVSTLVETQRMLSFFFPKTWVAYEKLQSILFMLSHNQTELWEEECSSVKFPPTPNSNAIPSISGPETRSCWSS